MTQTEELLLVALKGSEVEGWDLDVSITELNRCTNVEVSAMYEYPETQEKVTAALTAFFAPRAVEFKHRWSEAGCETCDNGSKYTLEFDVEKEDDHASCAA